MQAGSRGALATCGRVSQLNALTGTKTGGLESIRTSSVLRFLSLPQVAYRAQPYSHSDYSLNR